LTRRPIELISAPWSLGLRPPSPGAEPGTWRAPSALRAAGLDARLGPARIVELPRPPYSFEAQEGTRIRNGVTIREHTLPLADAVQAALRTARFPVVVGGDCSVLLGCLVGARREGRCGLVHLDGHSDFFHPANYDASSSLGAAAGMDLALATGHGEPLLTDWPGVGSPLVPDEDAIQLGDRNPDTTDGRITRVPVKEVLRAGVAAASARVDEWLGRRDLERVWLHVDVDVLDRSVMPAVDTPGRPGLDFAQLTELVSRLVLTGRIVGLDLTIYDPERDPEGRYAPAIVDCLAEGLAA
jgi:arginase